MKKLLTYSLLILVLYAFNYKTINYCLTLADRSSAYAQDYDCEKENSEDQKSDEKNEKDEKKELSECLSFDRIYTITILQKVSYAHHAKLIFAHSGYSMAVYSPPETTVI